ncbi:MAG: hypothetical protein GX921_10625 [Bacteroidales bacterium]|nr:hypothetical protein [Bacteroidales bacterium]
MTTNNHEYFEEIEIEHDFTTYYATGYLEYSTTECIGGSYEGYDFELLHETEIWNVIITELWHYDEETEDYVDILGVQKHKDIEELAEEEIRYRFE